MRAALCIIAFLLVSCGSAATGPKQSDDGRKRIECADSYLVISIPGDYKCEQFAREGGSAYGSHSYGGIFQTFNLFGKADDGTGLSLQGDKALVDGYYSPSEDPHFTYEHSIKSQDNPVVRRAKNWRPLRTVGTTRFIEFTDPYQRQCFGFMQFGGLSRGVYNYAIRGYFCRKSTPFTDDQVSALVSRITMRDSLSSPLPAAMLPKPMLTCALRDGSKFETTNRAGCLRVGGEVR
jgi:hypothetical protein